MKKWKFSEKFMVLLVSMLLLMNVFDVYILIVKGSLFVGSLIVAGYVDFKTKTIPDWVPILIMMLALIKIEWVDALLGLVVVPFPYFIMALLKENSMGGGDIKLMGACGFFLGLQAGYVASILGLLFAISVHFAYRVFGSKMSNKNIPLAPYLGAGSLIAYFVIR